MNDYSIRLAKPHCEACHQSKSKVEVEGVSTVDMLTGEESIRTLTLEPETSRVEFSEPLEEKTLGQAMTEDWQINHPLRREEDFKPTESGALGKAEVNDLRSRLNLKPDEEDI